MGFTLIHRKDGKEIPIKMSIWDAFHGAPNPRPRKPTPVRCSAACVPQEATNWLWVLSMLTSDLQCKCCGKTHAPKRVNNDAKKFDGKKGDGDDCKTNSYSTSPAVDWTPEDDAKMLAIKAAKPDAPWTDIQAACGGKGSKSTIAERLKFLRDNSGKADGEKAEEEKKQGEESKLNKEKKKAENPVKQDEEGKGGKKKKGKAKGQAEERKVSLHLLEVHEQTTNLAIG